MIETSNRLRAAASPYLQQHADNPVHWLEWGTEAFDLARRDDRPIFLSIGYAACHWCHVMAHESFEDGAIASQLNRDFISIKVDREERPDVDQIYMNALHALGEQGGWPLTMFLDADGRPFWGGTYFPPKSRYGRPGFSDVLLAVRKTWDEHRSRIEHNASGLRAHLEHSAKAPQGDGEFDSQELDDFANRLLELVDFERGGLSGAPKFPNAPITEAHFRAWKRTGDEGHLRAFRTTLMAMAQGGIFDQFGGGLARYSTDTDWLVPHFEKMLYDNAHFIAQASWISSGEQVLRDRISSTIEWLEREMQVGPAFASSLDADTDGVEGLTYTWTGQEVIAALGDNASQVLDAFGIRGEPNFEGRHIPHRSIDAPPIDDDTKRLVTELMVVRNERSQPGRDDKVLTDWNLMLVQALVASSEDDETVLGLAEAAFGMFGTDTNLPHSQRGGTEVGPALLSDRVELALAAIALSAATGRSRYDTAVEQLVLIERHYLVDGLPVMTHEDADTLIVRPSAFQDDPNPSPASRLSILLSQLDALGLLGARDLKDRLERALAAHLKNASFGTAGAANALDTAMRISTLVLYKAPAEWRTLVAADADPSRLVLRVDEAEQLPAGHSARTLCAGTAPLAILCEGRSCRPPVRSKEALAAILV